MTLVMRFADFALVVGLCIVWGVCARITVQSIFPQLSFWPASLLVIGFSSVALAVPVQHLVWGFAGTRPAVVPHAAVVAVMIAGFGIGAALLRWTLTEDKTALSAGGQPVAPAPSALAVVTFPRLVERLPPDTRGPLIRVSAQNHYVEIRTENGGGRVLLRLSDALAEIGDVDGVRVHRSHWVAARAVVGSAREGTKRVLILSDGSRIPIGRSYQDGAARLAEM